MGYWKSKPNCYNEHNFIEIPEGCHRVQIKNVRVERFNSGKKCYELTLKVSGYHGLLWFYLWEDPENSYNNAEKIYQFFDSFQIEDHDLKNYKNWVGKTGAVSVAHYDGVINGVWGRWHEYEAMVTGCLSGKQRDRLPLWKEPYAGPYKYEDPIAPVEPGGPF